MTSPIYKDRDFYVPAFEVRLRDRSLAPTIVHDIISVQYVDDRKSVDQFTLTVNNWDAATRSFKYSDQDVFLPKAKIEIDLGYYNGEMHRVITGEITDMQATFPAEGQPTLKVSGLNRLHDLRKKQESRVYEKMTDSAIARQIAGRLGLDVRTDASAERVEEENQFLFQHNQYDIVFLKDRARRLGYELLIEENDQGRPRLYFGPSDKIGRPTYHLTYGSTLIDFQPQLSTAKQVGEVMLHAHDHRNKRSITGRATRDQLRTKGVGQKGGQPRIAQAFADRREIVADHPVRSPKEADTLAREFLEQNAKQMVKGTGNVVGLPDLRAGSVVVLDGLGTRFSGRYFVEKTTHTIDDSGYRTSFECRLEELQA